MDALNVLELGLEDEELQFIFFKMFDSHRKGNNKNSSKYRERKHALHRFN